MNSNMDVSVVICCYNSEALIEETLRHIMLQKISDGFTFEVILVDNNCSDATTMKAQSFWNSTQTKIPLYIVKEPKPGLAQARKTGVFQCQSDCIIFCDDDNLLEENYLQTSYSFLQQHPQVGAVGGQSEGILETTAPIWWKDEALNFAVGKQSIASGDVSKRGYVWGAGLVIRKSILTRLYTAGFSSLLLGRTGGKITSGDDSEFCKWILILDYKLWYLDSLKFKHYITKARLTNEYLKKLKGGHEDSIQVLETYDWFIKYKTNLKIRRSTLGLIKKSVRLLWKGITGKDTTWRKQLQLVVGTKVKIHPQVHKMVVLYKNLKPV